MGQYERFFYYTYLSPNDTSLCAETFVTIHFTHKRPTLLVGEYGRDAAVLIDDNPRILRGCLEETLKGEIFEWITENKDSLLKYWSEEYSSFELLLDMKTMDTILRRNITEEAMAVNNDEQLTFEEEVQLIKQIQNDEGDVEAAKEKLIKANQRFVRSIVRQYTNAKLPIDDIIAEGNKGIEVAMYKYEETRGFRFISYAAWFIRRRIEGFLLAQLHKKRLLLDKLSEREINILEMSYGIGRAKVDLDEICAKYDLTRQRALYIKRNALRKVFLNLSENEK